MEDLVEQYRFLVLVDRFNSLQYTQFVLVLPGRSDQVPARRGNRNHRIADTGIDKLVTDA